MTTKQPDFFDDQAIKSLVAAVRPFSMVNEDSLLFLAEQVATTLRSAVPGHFVECGVWRGGASFLMAGLLRLGGSRDRKVWLFDSYEGLPPPDSATAKNYNFSTTRDKTHLITDGGTFRLGTLLLLMSLVGCCGLVGNAATTGDPL
jgi:hypothetical protein